MDNEWIDRQMQQFLFDFDQADTDKSGSLSFAEVFNVLKSQGFTGTEEEAQTIFKDFDKDKDKTISRDEYYNAMTKLPKLNIRDFYLRKMFKAVDKDGSGFLTRDEIYASMDQNTVGLDIFNRTAYELMVAQCRDQDGKLSYEEFLRVFKVETESAELRKLFTQLDKDKSGFLTEDEIRKQLQWDAELQLSIPKLIGLLKHLKTDADGKISYEEFIKVWQEENKK